MAQAGYQITVVVTAQGEAAAAPVVKELPRDRAKELIASWVTRGHESLVHADTLAQALSKKFAFAIDDYTPLL